MAWTRRQDCLNPCPCPPLSISPCRGAALQRPQARTARALPRPAAALAAAAAPPRHCARPGRRGAHAAAAVAGAAAPCQLQLLRRPPPLCRRPTCCHGLGAAGQQRAARCAAVGGNRPARRSRGWRRQGRHGSSRGGRRVRGPRLAAAGAPGELGVAVHGMAWHGMRGGMSGMSRSSTASCHGMPCLPMPHMPPPCSSHGTPACRTTAQAPSARSREGTCSTQTGCRPTCRHLGAWAAAPPT